MFIKKDICSFKSKEIHEKTQIQTRKTEFTIKTLIFDSGSGCRKLKFVLRFKGDDKHKGNKDEVETRRHMFKKMEMFHSGCVVFLVHKKNMESWFCFRIAYS